LLERPGDKEIRGVVLDPKDVSSVFHKHHVNTVPSLAVALEHSFCTFAATGPYFELQVHASRCGCFASNSLASQTSFRCFTCIDKGRMSGDAGGCGSCSHICHQAHRLSDPEPPGAYIMMLRCTDFLRKCQKALRVTVEPLDAAVYVARAARGSIFWVYLN